jgi:arginine transport system permease protein
LDALIVPENIFLLLHGVWITIQLMILALSIGLSIALLLTWSRLSCNTFFNLSVEFYIYVVRGTPLLLQLFIIYYGALQFSWLQATPLWSILKSPYNCAVIALAINTGAYTTELFTGAIKAIPKSQVEACQALGLNKTQCYWKILLPLALRNILPAYSNEVIIVLKATSLVSTITLLDITGATQQLIAESYLTLPWWSIAGALYLILSGLLTWLFSVLEQRYSPTPK